MSDDKGFGSEEILAGRATFSPAPRGEGSITSHAELQGHYRFSVGSHLGTFDGEPSPLSILIATNEYLFLLQNCTLASHPCSAPIAYNLEQREA